MFPSACGFLPPHGKTSMCMSGLRCRAVLRQSHRRFRRRLRANRRRLAVDRLHLNVQSDSGRRLFDSVSTRHATSVWQGNWFSVAIGSVPLRPHSNTRPLHPQNSVGTHCIQRVAQ